MVSQKQIAEELPLGWKEYVKVKNGRKIKFFTNMATGEKLYSRSSVFHAHSLQISQGNSPSCTPESGSVAYKSKASTDDMKANDSPEWLPHGWTVESRTRRSSLGSGSTYKIYIEPLTERKFYSKPQVMQYLQGLEDKNDEGRQQQQISEKTTVKRQDLSPSVEGKTKLSAKNKIVMKDKDGLDELPSGYTKEINTRKRALERRNALLLSESLENKNHVPGENENDSAKALKMNISDVQKKNGLDELPPGYTKEINTRKRALERRNALLLSKSLEDKNHVPGENENDSAKAVKMNISDVQQKNGLDELPSQCTKEINTRKRALERRNALQLSESLEYKNHIQGENENDSAKSLKMDISVDLTDVQQKNGLDELPPGWLKVSKSRKSTRATRFDPYYIEIASGYAFRSKRDVLRYLGTGDINSCATKPHKWDSSELKHKENNHCSTPYLGNEAGESVPRRQPFICQESEFGKESLQISNIVVAEAENPRVKDKETTSSTVDTHMGSGSPGSKKSRENSGLNVEGSKQDIKIVHGNTAVNSSETAGFNDQKLSDVKTNLRLSKKRTPSMPGRSSKRLAGHDPEIRPNFSLSERALRAAIKNPNEIGVDRTFSKPVDTTAKEVAPEQDVIMQTTTPPNLASNTAADQASQQPAIIQATTQPNLAWNTAADQASQQPINKLVETSRSSNFLATGAVANKTPLNPVVTEAEATVVHCTSVPAKVSSETGPENDFKVQSENQKTTGFLSQGQVEENTMSQVDYWSDPCWDFAFKTLTGAIPLEEALPSCFPQPTGTSYTEGNLNFGLQEFDIPSIFQNDVQQTDSVQNNNVSVDPLTTNSTLPPAGNINLPGCSSQPSVEAQGKDYQTKVKS